MFQTSFLRMTGTHRSTRRLEVEALEGRDMPSALPVLVNPAPLAAWSPPALVHVSESAASAGVIGPKAQANANAMGGPLYSGATEISLLPGSNFDVSHANHVPFSITRSSGEEIPQ